MLYVRDIMTDSYESIPVDTPIGKAAEIMLRRRIPDLPVTEDRRIVGIVRAKDIRQKLDMPEGDLKKTVVNELLHPEVIYCDQDQPAREVDQLLREKQADRVMVLNKDQDIVGTYIRKEAEPPEFGLTLERLEELSR